MSGGRLSLGALAAALAVTFALGAGEAAAQSTRVCDNAFSVLPLGTTEERVRELSDLLRQGAIAESPHVAIYCRYGRADRRNRGFLVHNPQIVVVDDFVPGIEAFHEGVGDLGIYVHAVSGEPGSAGDFTHPSPADYGQGIFTTGNAEDYITGEDSYGIHARHTGEGRAGIDVRNVSVRTTGDHSHGVYAWQQGSYRLDEDGNAYRAPGAVIVNLIETDRDRDQRVRPLVGTSGDYADAVRAQYTRAAARGHIAVTVEGYTLTTGGIVPESAIAEGVDPEKAIEVSIPRPRVFDQSQYDNNPNYDPSDPSLRPYTAVYLPVSNPDYDPDDPTSSPWTDGIALWNGRYFLALGRITSDYVNACQGESTAKARRTCYENKIVEDGGTNLPTGFDARGIHASHEGHGDIRIRATDTDIQTGGADAQGIYATHTGRTIVCGAPGSGCLVGGGTTPGGGGVSIVVTGGSIDTEGDHASGVWARHRGDSGADEADGSVDPDDVGTGNVSIAVTDADIDTEGDHASGVYGLIQQTCTADTAEGCKEAENLIAGTGVGDIDIAVTGGSITTAGVGGAYAVHARHENTGAIAVGLTGVAAATEGDQAHGVFAEHRGSAGDVSVTVDGGSIDTAGENAHGVYGAHLGEEGDVSISVANASISTTGGGTEDDAGTGGHGVFGYHVSAGGVSIDVNGGSIATTGDAAYGVRILHTGTTGDVSFRMTGGEISTSGAEAHAVRVEHDVDAGAVSVSLSGGSAAATGANASGVYVSMRNDSTLMVGADARVSASSGVAILAHGRGDLTATIAGMVEGDLLSIMSGVLDAEISGTVKGDVRGGDLDVTVRAPGTIEGDVRSSGDLTATIDGMVTGDVEGLGEGDHTVTVSRGGVVRNTIRLAASEVTLNGTAGRVWLEAGGTVTVGATGKITGVGGVAIQSDGGELTVNLNLASRRVADVLVGDIVADPDATTLLVNGETVNAGADAGNGAFDVRLSAGDGRLSLSQFYAPRAGLYEALPGLLLRLGGAQSKGERKTLPGSPVWASVLSGNGSRGKANSTVSKEDGVKYDFDQSGAEAGLGLSFPWADGLRASLSIRQVNASANLSMGSGKGEIDLEGVGYAFGFSWENGGGWYASGDLGLTDYAADFVSGNRGGLKHDVDASVRSLNLEAGRRLTLDRWAKRIALTPRVWVTRASVDVDDFTDSAGARFKLVEGDRLTGGAGVVAEAGFARGGGRLSLRGALDVETALSGEKTSVEVSGHRLHAEAEKTRFLMGVGARWRKGRFEIGGELNAAGLGSDDRTLGGRLNLGVQF